MANSRQSTRSRVVASTSPPPDPRRPRRRPRTRRPTSTAERQLRGRRRPLPELDRRPLRARARPSSPPRRARTMDENYSNPLVASPSIVYPPSPSAPCSLAVRPATSKPPPRRARAAHLHDGELPRSPPPFSLVPFACDDAAAALNIAARPVPPTTLSARRVSRVSRVSLARARAGMKQSPNGGPVSRATTDSRRPRARSPPSTTERERERSPVSSLARLARSLARHDRARPRRASHCRRRGGWLSCRGTEGDTLTSHRPS